MQKVSSYMGFACGETVFFRHDSEYPCVKGSVRTIWSDGRSEAGGALFRVDWEGRKITSLVPYECVFKSEELCRAYAASLREK